MIQVKKVFRWKEDDSVGMVAGRRTSFGSLLVSLKLPAKHCTANDFRALRSASTSALTLSTENASTRSRAAPRAPQTIKQFIINDLRLGAGGPSLARTRLRCQIPCNRENYREYSRIQATSRCHESLETRTSTAFPRNSRSMKPKLNREILAP